MEQHGRHAKFYLAFRLLAKTNEHIYGLVIIQNHVKCCPLSEVYLKWLSLFPMETNLNMAEAMASAKLVCI